MVNGTDGLGEGSGRISLWKLDRLMQGDLPGPEADALRAAVSQSPEALAYLERNASLKSGLALQDIRFGASSGGSQRKARPAGNSGWIRVRDLLSLRSGMRGPGYAFAFVLALGIGVWTWRIQDIQDLQGAPAKVAVAVAETARPGNYSIKGSGEADFRITIRDTESDTGQLISARNGDTLGLNYRSARPVTAQIWYREEGRQALPMTGTAETIPLEAAMSWRPAGPRIVLEGDWNRQTVWVVWSAAPFTSEAAKGALDGSANPALRIASFRMVRQP
jgi:hypothetical protein